MMHSIPLERTSASTEISREAARAVARDDKAMLKAAADLTRELNVAKPSIYWTDFLGSTLLGYAALAGAVLFESTVAIIVSCLVAVLALYRAGSFIHELTHIKKGALPGFRFAWNLLIGVPLLLPSFLYEGVHNQHHAKRYYGTVDDPEYLPLALMKPWTVPILLVVAILMPVALIVRFALLAPLSLFSTRLRRFIVGRYSGLQINPLFRRSEPDGEFARQWAWQEVAASAWAMVVVAAAISGAIAIQDFLLVLSIASGVMILNSVRTLAAHLWENEGEAMSVTAQYLDSVNVPPPATLPALWAPVGLRYHALHHLLPGLPYHALGEAHRRLCAELDGASPYHVASHRGLSPLVARLAASTLGTRRTR